MAGLTMATKRGIEYYEGEAFCTQILIGGRNSTVENQLQERSIQRLLS
jgi:hypothetical protein